MPSLFGRAGGAASIGPILRSILHVCISREFTILADRTSRVVPGYALAAKAHAECGGPGVEAPPLRGGNPVRMTCDFS